MPEQEKKVLDALDGAVKEVEIPESLHPENIQKMLEQSERTRKISPGAGQKSQRAGAESGWKSRNGSSQTGHKFKWNKYYSYVAAAAMFVLVIGAGMFSKNGMLQDFSGGLFNEKVTAVQEAADEAVNETVKSEMKSAEADDKPAEEVITSAGTYGEVYDYIKTWQDAVNKTQKTQGTGDDFALYNDGSGADTEGLNSKEEYGFSDTNVRTDGIGEADIVKTDGTYLYVLKKFRSEIAIVDARADKMKLVSTIKARKDAEIAEFYVDGKQVFVLTTVAKYKPDKKGGEFFDGYDMEMQVYNVKDIASPKLTDSIIQSGHYKTSRFVDGYIYLLSEFYVDECKKDDFHSFIPLINGKLLPEDRIYLPEEQAANHYTVVVSVKADNPGEIVDQKAVLSEYGECYISHNNIYIYENMWDSVRFRSESSTSEDAQIDARAYGLNFNERNRTLIRRISYKNGRLKGEAKGKVEGSLHNSFSIDEYDGNLRVVTTINDPDEITNAVFVLDKDLKIIGKITNLAKGELVYSARFFGETGYFVTFRQTDPLFSVDFSNPKKPTIIGSLKIPGFSEYLHFYGDGMLLGIGMDADEKSGTLNGVKISMFDISDPSDVKEVHKYIIKDAYSSEVFNDYRAVLIDHKKNMIGFSTDGNRDNYYIFSYDKVKGFHVEMKEEVNGTGRAGTRGLYIGERFYVVRGNTVESYRMEGFEKVDDLVV